MREISKKSNLINLFVKFKKFGLYDDDQKMLTDFNQREWKIQISKIANQDFSPLKSNHLEIDGKLLSF